MKDDIKKKFIDILFETDEDEESETIIDAPVEDVRFSSGKKQEKKFTDTPITANAKDYLYSKEHNGEVLKKRTSFINMDGKYQKNSDKRAEEKKNSYVLSSNLSPMFGVIGSADEVDENANMSVAKNNSYTSCLGTVISPFYGTDVKNDYSNSHNLSVNIVDKHYEPFIVEEEAEDDKPDINVNDTLTDNDNIFINEQLEEEFSKNEEDFVDESENISEDIYRTVLNEERGTVNTQEIDLFEDLFKEDRR